jgi:hypothetical protein
LILSIIDNTSFATGALEWPVALLLN